MVYIQKCFNRFQFYNNLSLNQNIQAIFNWQNHTVIYDFHPNLFSNFQTIFS